MSLLKRRTRRAWVRRTSPLLAHLQPLGAVFGDGVSQPFLTPFNAPAIFGDALALKVSPAAIDLKMPRGKTSSWPLRFVFDGDWDLEAKPLFHELAFRRMENLLQHREDIARSDVYREMMQRIAEGAPAVKAGVTLADETIVRRYCQGYIGVADSMAASGYRTDLAHDTIEVLIGRTGRILHLQHGNHRLAFARILDLPLVPVNVSYVHRQAAADWMQRFGVTVVPAIRRGLAELNREATR